MPYWDPGESGAQEDDDKGHVPIRMRGEERASRGKEMGESGEERGSRGKEMGALATFANRSLPSVLEAGPGLITGSTPYYPLFPPRSCRWEGTSTSGLM